MSEENTPTTGTQEVTSKPDAVAPATETKEEASQDDLNALEKAINEANDSLVSKDVQEQVKVAREQAKMEAQKEFETNQKIKELEAQLKAKEDEKVELQKQTVEQLQALKTKVDDMTASKAIAPTQTPFDKAPEEPEKDKLDMNADEMAQFETDSYRAFAQRTINKN